MAYNGGVNQNWALNTSRMSVAVNNSVNFTTLNWCPTCGVCNNYNLLIDSYFMNRSDEDSSGPMCFCTADLLDTSLLGAINKIAGSKSEGPFATLLDGMNWVRTNGIFVTNQNYPSIVTSGCTLNLDASLPASYPMVGTNWYDLTANNNNAGTLVNGVTYNSTLKGFLTFNGSNQYVSFTTPTNIPISNSNYTISVWFKANSLGDKGLVGWGNYSSTNEVNAFKLTSSGLSNYWLDNDLSVTTTITTGLWYNAVATFDGTTRSIWVNGALINSDTPTGHNVPNANNLTIGVTNTSEYFDGSIGEVQIFNRGLSSDEITSNFNELLTRYNGSNTEICVTPFYCDVPCITLVTAIQECSPGQVNVTYIVSRYNSLADGSFDSGSGPNFTTETLTVSIGTNLSVTAEASIGSTFVGWSTTQSILNPLTTNTTFSHTANYNITYYAVMNKTGVIVRSFCYYSSGSTIDNACLDCSVTTNVYFNSTSYYSNSLENITWYSNEGLTITVPDGLYKINDNSNITSLTIYSLTGGDATVLGVCGSDPLTCCP